MQEQLQATSTEVGSARIQAMAECYESDRYVKDTLDVQAKPRGNGLGQSS